MRKIIILFFTCFFLSAMCIAQTTNKKAAPVKKESKNKSELKEGAKAGWHGVKEAGRAVGRTSKRVVKSVRHDTKKTVKDVKKEVKK